MDKSFIKTAFGNGIYCVSHPMWGAPQQDGKALMNSWVVCGKEKTMIIDSGVPEIAGFRDWMEAEFGKNLMMVNSHGHVDHVGCNGQFDIVYINEKDLPLLYLDYSSAEFKRDESKVLSYRTVSLKEGDTVDLGGRVLDVYEVQGHTRGSLIFFDRKTGSLFSGDAVARRLLYGLMEETWVPLADYLKDLRKLETLPVTAVYSMHDAFALPADLPYYIRVQIIKGLRKWYDEYAKKDTAAEILQLLPGGPDFLHFQAGEGENDPRYFDFVMPLSHVEETVTCLKENGVWTGI